MEGSDHNPDLTDYTAALSEQGLYVEGDGGNPGDESIAVGGEGEDGEKGGCSPLREQDRFLPIANVSRIMKKSIPKSGKIARDAKECVQECVSEFISFITSEASERCHQEKRKTINGEDILFAMSTLGFDNYVEPLKVYLQKYRESMKGDKTVATAGNRTDIVTDEIAEEDYGITTNLMAADQATGSIVVQAYPGSQISAHQLQFT